MPGDTVTLTIYRSGNGMTKASTFDVEIVLLEDKGETQQAEEAQGILHKTIKTTPKGRGMNDKPYKGIIPAAPKGAQ